jgi:mannose-6-phosphate isomerase-like protein (cupin superfamily)
MSAVVRAPGEGETITGRAERKLWILDDRPELCVTEAHYGGGQDGAEPHVHREHVDAFWIIEGELLFGLGQDDEVRAEAGSFVLAPPDLVHSFRNGSREPVRYLNLHAPDSGFAEMLRARRDDREPTVPWDSFDPPADGGRPSSDAVLLRPGEGETLSVGGTRVTLKATGETTGGRLYLGESAIEPGFPGPPPHVHRTLHDAFYVLDGTLTLRIGDETVEASSGSFACFPPGVVHTFSNPGSGQVRLLNFNTPAGWENYMRHLAATLAAGSPTPEEIGQIASRYDFRVV